MATDRVCPHCITLWNYMGEDESGSAKYSCTLLCGVHVHTNEGVSADNQSQDETRVHIFDDTIAALPPAGQEIDKNLFNLSPYNLQRALETPDGEKPFVPYAEWKSTTSKEQYWTLNPEGKDYFSIGDDRESRTSLPTYKTLFRIVQIGRREMGTRRMWHWRIEAQ